MAQTLKTIYAGALQVRGIYDRCSRRDGPQQRQAKRNASSAAQRRMNQIYSYQKLELMLSTNFPTAGSALVLTLTFDERHLPGSRKQTQRCMAYFLRRFRAERRAAGLPEPVVFWAPEILTSESGRWHLHAVVDNTGRDYEMIRRCWIYGGEIEIRPLRVDDEKNHETLARYMTKELRECQEYVSKPGLHGWSCTRNAKKPEVDTVVMPDDYEPEIPPGWTVLLDEHKATSFASWRVLKLRCAPGESRRPRARRRRKR